MQPGTPALQGITPAIAAALAAAALLAGVTLGGGGSKAVLAPTGLGGARGMDAGAFERLPLAFEPNAGRTEPRVDFIARGAATHLINGRGATVALPGSASFSLRLVGGRAARGEPLERLPGVVNSLVGDDPSGWRRGLPTFERIRYAGVWPGIDLHWYGNRRRLEYDFVVAPGADPARIAVRFSGQDSLRLDPGGDLVIRAGGESARQLVPVAFQRGAEGREPVEARYVLDGRIARLRLGDYDRGRPLVIDPLIYLGVIDAEAIQRGVAVDSTGQMYVTGDTDDEGYPTTSGSFQDTDPDPGAGPENDDAYVTKINASGTAAVYSTYLGGDGTDNGRAIAVDSDGEAYVVGDTESTDFPTTADFESSAEAGKDGFIAKLNAAGSDLAYSRYFGGAASDNVRAIDVNPDGLFAFVAGSTLSTDYDTAEPGDLGLCDISETDPHPSTDAFFTGFDADGDINCSTMFGGDSNDEARDIVLGGGFPIITGFTVSTDFPTSNALHGNRDGFDAFVVSRSLFTPYSTYLGGDEDDVGQSIDVDSDGRVWVGGATNSDSQGGAIPFPTTPGAFQPDDPQLGGRDGFLTRLSKPPVGAVQLSYSSYLGGGGENGFLEEVSGLHLDESDAIYAAGVTDSAGFPTTAGSVDRSLGGNSDAFLVKLNPDGSALDYGTYLGGPSFEEGIGLAVDPAGAAYLAGTTGGLDLALTPGEFDQANAGQFLAKLTPVPERPPPRCGGLVATRSGTAGPDVIVGTPRRDVITALGGRDNVRSLGGRDLVCGARGNDRLIGGRGPDVLLGQAGQDLLKGGAGRDRLKGGAGRDRCIGGAARDRARGCERKRSIRR